MTESYLKSASTGPPMNRIDGFTHLLVEIERIVLNTDVHKCRQNTYSHLPEESGFKQFSFAKMYSPRLVIPEVLS